jgi:Pyruvate/2-oxoacid:ferredoxin oxidoreductase delta subunit
LHKNTLTPCITKTYITFYQETPFNQRATSPETRATNNERRKHAKRTQFQNHNQFYGNNQSSICAQGIINNQLKGVVFFEQFSSICVLQCIKNCFLKGYYMPAVVDNEKCTGCESCVEECPSEAIAMAEEKAQIDIDACVDCAACVDACPTEAISME